MDDQVLDAQYDLVRRIADAGWTVTDAELSLYQSPWEEDVPEATVTITARRPFPGVETGERGVPEGERDDEDRDNPFRLK